MKILRLELENLNSLRGKHEVRFSEDPIVSAGIFSITGPTGAGKSTLLDAITLALYGRAARYGNESNPGDMMTRHTGHCRAEVEFEVAGKVYRSEWQLNRARGNAEGKLQPAKRFVYDAAGVVLTQKLREADDKIEKLTGLNHDRFMRSVLLAQGDFARFLKASADERAGLLESLTATGIYSGIGSEAYAFYSDREAELKKREMELGFVQPLGEEARAEAEVSVREFTDGLKVLRKELSGESEAIVLADQLSKELEREKLVLSNQEKIDFAVR